MSTDRIYCWTQRGIQKGIPAGQKKCRDCLEVKVACKLLWHAGSRIGTFRQPCRECEKKAKAVVRR